MSFRGRGRGGFGGRGGDRGGFRGGRFGGRGRGEGRGWQDYGPPSTVVEVGVVKHPCEGEIVCKLTSEGVRSPTDRVANLHLHGMRLRTATMVQRSLTVGHLSLQSVQNMLLAVLVAGEGRHSSHSHQATALDIPLIFPG